MRSVKAGVLLGILWLLGGCMVEDDPPVPGSTPLWALTNHEVVYLCDWAIDIMGGRESNPGEGRIESDDGIYHRCPDTREQLGDPGADRNFRAYQYEECTEDLVEAVVAGATLTVDQFASWIRAIADSPCEYHYVADASWALVWYPTLEEDSNAP